MNRTQLLQDTWDRVTIRAEKKSDNFLFKNATFKRQGHRAHHTKINSHQHLQRLHWI